MTPDPDAEWWNTTDVAAFLGVRVATVSTYRKREQMPPPDQSLGRTHLWRPATVMAWHGDRPRPGVGGRPADAPAPAPVPTPGRDGASRWTVHGERVLYDNPWARLSLVDVEHPGGNRYESHVVTLPTAAMTVVLNDAKNAVLLLWRHRFAVDRWGWELPGGVVDADESPTVTAIREVEEETGYHPLNVSHAVTFEPMVGQVRSPHHVFVAHGAEQISDAREATESDTQEWVPLTQVASLIGTGDITSSGSLVGLLYVLSGLGR